MAVVTVSLAADDMTPEIKRAITEIKTVKSMSLHLREEMIENRMTDQRIMEVRLK